MAFIDKYKSALALVLGTLCLIIALYAPAKSALLLTDKELDWKASNWIFLGLGIIFLWGEIVTLARTFQDLMRKRTE